MHPINSTIPQQSHLMTFPAKILKSECDGCVDGCEVETHDKQVKNTILDVFFRAILFTSEEG